MQMTRAHLLNIVSIGIQTILLRLAPFATAANSISSASPGATP